MLAKYQGRECLQYPEDPVAYFPLLHLFAVLRSVTLPPHPTISWSLVYENLFGAALCTLPSYCHLSLTTYTIYVLDSHIATALLHLACTSFPRSSPICCRLPQISQSAVHFTNLEPGLQIEGELPAGMGNAWTAADGNDGNPAGQKHFEKEEWKLLEEAGRWRRGLCFGKR